MTFGFFCKSHEEAVIALHALSEYLCTAHRLSLQAGKTEIQKVGYFRTKELADPGEQERRSKEKKIADLIESSEIGFYGQDEVDPDEVEADAIKATIDELFQEALDQSNLPIGLVRYLLRRAGALRTRTILQKTLNNVDKLLPVMRDLVVYWNKVVDKKKPRQIGETLQYLLEESPYKTIPYIQYWVLSAFETEPKFCDAATAIELAEKSDGQIRDRMAALLARRHGVVDWVRSRKENWSNTPAWGQRAIIWASSVLPKDERRHWLKPICNYPVLGTAVIAKAAACAPEKK